MSSIKDLSKAARNQLEIVDFFFIFNYNIFIK